MAVKFHAFGVPGWHASHEAAASPGKQAASERPEPAKQADKPEKKEA